MDRLDPRRHPVRPHDRGPRGRIATRAVEIGIADGLKGHRYLFADPEVERNPFEKPRMPASTLSHDADPRRHGRPPSRRYDRAWPSRLACDLHVTDDDVNKYPLHGKSWGDSGLARRLLRNDSCIERC